MENNNLGECMPRLKNKIVLITGAARGIGKAISELFNREGATVIVTDILEEQGAAVVSELGENATFIKLDVTSEQDWQAVTQHIEQTYGHLDVLVNNAGITGLIETQTPQDPENLEIESWRKVHAVNLEGVVLGCKYGIKLMKAASAASIVNISSRSGMVGIPGASAYASSKAAVRNHTKSVALYCAGQGYPIRCNSIHPGAILTPMWDPMLGDDPEAAKKAIAADIPMGHMGNPMDVAYAALYLASPESGYVTGTELTIDGGILAGAKAAPAAQTND